MGYWISSKKAESKQEKKTLYHPKADEKERLKFQFRILSHEHQGRTIVYLDESGFAVDAPRTHGYSLCGKRCYDSKDWHAKGRINAIGAIVDFDFIAICLWDCYINADTFYQWVTQDLLPKTPPHSVIIMDNASFHKREDIILAIQKAGHIIEFLPPYSPDLTPIEKKWAQAKSIRRKLRCDPYQLFLHPGL